MISSGSAYSVDMTVDGRYLEDAALVSSSALLRPVFSSDAADDPDARALRVLLLGADEEALAGPVEYRERAVSALLEAEDGVILIDSLSAELPGFALPPDLAVGRYTLRFEVLGEEGTLYEDTRPLFFTAAETLTLVSAASFPPGVGPAAEAPLFPPDTLLLLEAVVDAGDGLDPYLVWTAGGKRLSAARASAGGARLFWETPSAAGFVRVEVSLYPTEPRSGELESMKADARSLTIAVSADAAVPGLPEPDAAYERVYRLLGDLSDRGSASDGSAPLEAAAGAVSEWLPFSSGYGLAVGPRREFRSAASPLPSRGGSFVPSGAAIRAALLGEGLLWQASFPGIDGAPPAELLLEAAAAGPRLTLRIGTEEASIEAPLDPAYSAEAVVLELGFAPPQEFSEIWEISLSVDGSSAGALPFDASSFSVEEGRFSIGGGESDADGIVAVVDDIASFLADGADPSAAPVPEREPEASSEPEIDSDDGR